MARTAELLVRVKSTSDAAGLDQANSKMAKFRSGLGKAAIPAAIAGAAILKLGKDSVDAASRLQQSMGGVDAVFGKNAATIKRWAGDTSDAINLSKSDYGELATLIGSQMKNAGLPMDQVTKKTGEIIAKGADLAAMYGGTTKEAVEALSSAFKGEFDPMDRYGGGLSAAKIAAQQAAEGTDKLTGKAADQAKAMATLNLINKQTADSVGAAAKEQGSAASQTEALSVATENLKADLGTALLPIVSKVAAQLAKLAGWMAKNKTATQILIGVIGGLAAAVLVLNAAMLVLSANPIALIVVGIVAAVIALGVALTIAYKRSKTFRTIVNAAFSAAKASAQLVVRGFQAIARAAQVTFSWIRSHWRLIAAILFGPVGIAVGVISKHWGRIRSGASTLLSWIRTAFRNTFQTVASIVRTYIAIVKTVIDGVKTAVHNVTSFLGTTWRTAWNTAKSVALIAINAIKSPIETVKSTIDGLISKVQSLISWLGRIKVPKIKIPGAGLLSKVGLSARAAAPMTAATAPSTLAAPMVRSAARPAAVGATSAAYGPGGLVININGALDPEGTARAVARVVRGHNRRIGVRTA